VRIQAGVRFRASESRPLASTLVLLSPEIAEDSHEPEIDQAERRARVLLAQPYENIRGLQISMDEAEIVK
jgi:hypothetical protein